MATKSGVEFFLEKLSGIDGLFIGSGGQDCQNGMHVTPGSARAEGFQPQQQQSVTPFRL